MSRKTKVFLPLGCMCILCKIERVIAPTVAKAVAIKTDRIFMKQFSAKRSKRQDA